MNTREAFEAWHLEQGCQPETLLRKGDGYSFINVDAAWFVWQAGAAWAARECVKECDGAFVCCGNRVVGAEYMGSSEMICCGEPIEQKTAADVAKAIRARFPEAFK